jgi:methyltransferase (TIGR00027 family)
MKAGKASRTAQYMALFRALETKRPARKRLFTDPFAVAFLDTKLQLVTRFIPVPGFHQYVYHTIQRKIPGALSSGIARTKYIDDLVQRSVQQGIQQVIILGAGFDTRALRLNCLQHIPVIEIDHPNTAALKMKVLTQKLGALPGNVRYLQIDFNKQSLDELAATHSIDFLKPALFIWEGVTNYLIKEAIDSTFAFVQRFAPGSGIIFTYVHQRVLDEPAAFVGGEKLLHDLEAIEERWTVGFYPHELPAYLQTFGLTLTEDKGADEYRHQYLPERTQQGYGFYRVAFAQQ